MNNEGNKYIDRILKKIDLGRIPYFVFIGTDRSYIDGIAPRLGTRLKTLYKTLGKEEKNLDAKTIEDFYNSTIKLIDRTKYQVIGVDCGYHDNKISDREILISDGIKPASYLGKVLPKIGEFGLVVNTSLYVNSLSEFLTTEYREDIKSLEELTYNTILKLFDFYPIETQVKILEDKGYDDDYIKNKLGLEEIYREFVSRKEV